MSDSSHALHGTDDLAQPFSLLWRLAMMAGSALFVSAAIIIYSNRTLLAGSDGSESLVALAASHLMPYMISAVVAAVTATAIITILPMLRVYRSVTVIRRRLHEMASGDLSSKIFLHDLDAEQAGLVSELNLTVAALGHAIAEWKVLNRSQWERLQTVRQAARRNDFDSVIENIERMEITWEKVASIEERLTTS
ncbi:MAG: hypothetical protein KAT79_00265 [candidate division Zixibacteria bacterium]|nr:hypothetical protein [candidate division Zixibacteria bacterium]